MRISDWSSDVCSSDLTLRQRRCWKYFASSPSVARSSPSPAARYSFGPGCWAVLSLPPFKNSVSRERQEDRPASMRRAGPEIISSLEPGSNSDQELPSSGLFTLRTRSEEHTSELKSLMRITY